MDKQEHLNRIKAKCLANLALAEKRTQGKWEWEAGMETERSPYIDLQCGDKVVLGPRHDGNYGSQLISTPTDRAFIAACAGPAEAGWRSTIIAIDALLEYESEGLIVGGTTLTSILAAWPENLL